MEDRSGHLGQRGAWGGRSLSPSARSPAGAVGQATSSTTPSPLSPPPTEGGALGGQTPTPSPGLFERAPRPPCVARVAIVGRPNVGKSTLFNGLLGEERSIVHDIPGTTRDAIDTASRAARARAVIDTAGMRRAARSLEARERPLRARGRSSGADVAILVIDATAGVTHQDQRLAERIGAPDPPSWWP